MELLDRRQELDSLEELATRVTQRMKIEISHHEHAMLQNEPRAFIGAIEANVVQPSKGLAVALVSALDNAKELSEEEKQRLYKAYEASGAAARAPRSRPAEGVARRPRVPVDAESDQVSPVLSATQ